MKTIITPKTLVLYLLICLMFVPLVSISAQGEIAYSQDFENGHPPEWSMDDGWEIVEVDGGHALSGQGHTWARVDIGPWEDYVFRFRAKLEPEADLHANIRLRHEPFQRYYITVNQAQIAIHKQVGEEFYERLSTGPGQGDGWHLLELEVEEGLVSARVDGEESTSYEDPDPIPYGGIAFESVGSGIVLIDEVEVELGEVPESPQQPMEGELSLGELTWVSTGGPLGGLGYDIRMTPGNPDVMYVTDAWAGAFKSTDGGENWFPINEGITARVGPSGDGIPVFSLTVDPNNPDTLWAGTQFGGGVFRSDNGGETWRSMSNGILEQSLTIRGFTVEPGNSDVVYLGGEVASWEWNGEPLNGVGFDLTKGVVYKTTDGGQNWERIWYGDNLSRYIWIHPQDHNLLYVSTGIFDREAANSDPDTLEPGGVGILRSRDGGATWEELGVENGIREDELYFGSLYMHPENPDILFGAAGNDAYIWALDYDIGAIYRTKDGGDTWERVLDLPNASAVEICENDPDVVYAASASAFYRSDDGGDTWQRLGGSGDLQQTGIAFWGSPDEVAGFPIDMQCDFRDPMRIFVNNYGGGNFLSEDGGATWVNASRGYTGATMHEIIVAPNNPAQVFATARSGVFTSQNGGETWQGLSHGVARAMEAYAIAVNPFDPSHLITTVGDAGPVPKISHDGGQTWREAEPVVDGMEFFEWGVMKTILFSPTEQDRLIGIQAESFCVEDDSCDEGYGVIFSRDGGETWHFSNLQEGIGTDLAFAPNGDVYVVLYPSGHLYRSSDGGETWEGVAENITAGVDVRDRDPDMPGPALVSLAVDPANPEKLYAGFSRGGVMVSVDGGVTWEASSAGMDPESSVVDLAADGTHPGVVYASTAENGVFVSTDGGETWRTLNEGLRTRAGVDLALAADGSVLYLATSGGGVFRLGTPGGEGAEEAEGAEEPEVAKGAEEAEGEEEVEGAEEAEVTEGAEEAKEVEGAEESAKPGLPCLGGLLPLGVLGLVLSRRRRSEK
ncbi:MAG: Xyloglucanase Xgh74A [Chloroflexi bacterium]|nr:Xyloglucanase Xgh74A [Chloroflexota bacterium]